MAAQKAGVEPVRRSRIRVAVGLLAFVAGRAHAQDTSGPNAPPPLPPAPPALAKDEEKAPPSTPQFEDVRQKPVPVPKLDIDRVRGAAKDAVKDRADANAKAGQKKKKPVTLEHADETTLTENEQVTIGRGDVRFRTAEYAGKADKVTWDKRSNFLVAEGNVILTGTPYPVYADFVRIDLRTQEFTTRGGRTIIPAENIGTQIAQPVFVSGETLSRIGKNYNATNGLLTTCDFPNPHFKIGFRQMDIIPKDRIVLRDNILYRYDKKVIRIKYLTFPIREERQPSYVPEFGRTNEEGYYVKAALGYTLSRILPGILRVDYLQKKGIGLGFDQAYQLGGGAAVGTLAFYTLNDKSRGTSTYNGRVNHQQYLGDTLATFSSDFQNNSYQALTSSSRTSNSTLNLDRTVGRRRSNGSITYGRSDYGTTNSDTTSYTLSEVEPLGKDGNITFRLNGSDQTSRSSYNNVTTLSGRSEQSADIKATGKFGIFDADLSANKNLFIHEKGSNTGASFSGTQRLPDFLLTTDLDRILGLDRARQFSPPPPPLKNSDDKKNDAKKTADKETPDKAAADKAADGKKADDKETTGKPENDSDKTSPKDADKTPLKDADTTPIPTPKLTTLPEAPPEKPKESLTSKIAQVLPFRFSLGYGRFLENVTKFTGTTATTTVVPVTTNRFIFDMETARDPQFRLTPGGAMTLAVGGGFKQTVYRQDAAQYILTGRSNLRQRLGENSSANLNYNYQRPYGGTPSDFRLDRIGAFNNAALNVNVDTYRTRLGVSTGYDFERAGGQELPGFSKNPWQNLSVQLGLRPSNWFQTRFTSTYDFNHGKWLDLTNRMRFRGNHYFALDTSLRYDPLRNKFPQVTSALTVPLFSQTVFLNALNGYNGVTSKFDYQRYSITWGFHDYDYFFSFVDQPYGYRTERGFSLTIRLRALPQVRASTTGQYGTSIDTGSGEVF